MLYINRIFRFPNRPRINSLILLLLWTMSAHSRQLEVTVRVEWTVECPHLPYKQLRPKIQLGTYVLRNNYLDSSLRRWIGGQDFPSIAAWVLTHWVHNSVKDYDTVTFGAVPFQSKSRSARWMVAIARVENAYSKKKPLYNSTTCVALFVRPHILKKQALWGHTYASGANAKPFWTENV
jgi:hypothetical protein